MNILDQPTITRGQFRKALNIKCHKTFGLGLMDLPDVICIDDFWWDGITEKEATIMVDAAIDDLKGELNFDSYCTVELNKYLRLNMSQERKSVSDLVNLLIKAKKDQHHIVFILESMIKQHMMYGASLQDQINYQIAIVEKDLI